jgi:hypothetical protein
MTPLRPCPILGAWAVGVAQAVVILTISRHMGFGAATVFVSLVISILAGLVIAGLAIRGEQP